MHDLLQQKARPPMAKATSGLIQLKRMTPPTASKFTLKCNAQSNSTLSSYNPQKSTVVPSLVLSRLDQETTNGLYQEQERKETRRLVDEYNRMLTDSGAANPGQN